MCGFWRTWEAVSRKSSCRWRVLPPWTDSNARVRPASLKVIEMRQGESRRCQVNFRGERRPAAQSAGSSSAALCAGVHLGQRCGPRARRNAGPPSKGLASTQGLNAGKPQGGARTRQLPLSGAEGKQMSKRVGAWLVCPGREAAGAAAQSQHRAFARPRARERCPPLRARHETARLSRPVERTPISVNLILPRPQERTYRPKSRRSGARFRLARLWRPWGAPASPGLGAAASRASPTPASCLPARALRRELGTV